MRPGEEKQSSLCDSVLVFLSLLVAVTLFVSQSVYELLAADPISLSFLVSSNLQLLGIILFFNWLPALLGFSSWWFLRRLNQKWAGLYLTGLYVVSALPFFFQIHNRYGQAWSLFPHAYVLWLIPALLVGLGWNWALRNLRLLVLLLTLLVVIFPALFLLSSWSREGPPARPSDRAGHSSNLSIRPGRVFPIFLVVLDEFSLPLILDNEAQIDRGDFPQIWELAQHSYWFRNATANADSTFQSMPALFTGNFPVSDVPSYEDYPRNLLSLLDPFYEVYADEAYTRFCRPAIHRCPGGVHHSASSPIGLYREVLFLYGRAIVPLELAEWLRRRWGPFRDVEGMMNARLLRFRSFLDTLNSLADRENVLVFFHHELPHNPYVLTREGGLLNVYPALFPSHPGDRQLVTRLTGRYREQIQFVDGQLGRFLAELKRVGLYEKSLVLITSDHGVSYLPQAPGRDLQEVDGELVNADPILRVPLFVKLPFQRQGVVSDRDVQLIDIVPTITDLLDLQLPWQVAGRSVFDEGTKPRAKVAYAAAGGRFALPAELDWESVALPPAPGSR